MGFSISGLQGQPLDDVVGLAKRDSSDDSDAMEEIVRRFTRRATVIVMALTDDSGKWDDMKQEAYIALTRAVRRHRSGRPGFPTYAIKYMRGAARRELQRLTGPAPESLSAPDVWDVASTVIAPTSQAGRYCWGYGPAARVVSTLAERQKELLTQRYVHDAPLTTIAANGGTSVSAVSQRLATAHRAVRAALAAA